MGTEVVSEKVPVAQAARMIGCAPEYLRRRMKAKEWDLGQVVKPPRGGTNYRYYIFQAKLDKFLGKGSGGDGSA